MSSGASVGSIYGSMILDTSQYEKALREIAGLSTNKGKTIEKSFTDVDKRIKGIEDSLRNTKKPADSLAQALVGIGAVFSAGAIVGGLKSMVTEAGKFQQIETSFRVMIGSAGDYKEVLNDLNQLSIKTHYTPEQIFKSGKALLAFNVEAKDLNKTVTMLGNIAAGTGKDLTELSVIYGQIKSSGRLMGQDLLQLINAGFNPLAEISKETGRSMKDLKKDMEDGNISFEMVEQTFKNATSEGGKFFGMMEEQSKTLPGKLSTLEGNVAELQKAFGLDGLAGPVGVSVDAFNNLITAMIGFREKNPAVFKGIAMMTTAAAAFVAILIGGAGIKMAIMTLLPMLEKLGLAATSAGGKISLAFGPAGVAFLAVVALIGIMTTLQAKMDEFNANESKSAASNLAKDLKSVKQSDVNHILNMLDNASKYANKTGSEQHQINQGLRTMAGLYPDIVILQGASAENAAEFAKRIREANKEVKDLAKNTPTSFSGLGGTAKTKGEIVGISGSVIELQKEITRLKDKQSQMTVAGSDAYRELGTQITLAEGKLKKLTQQTNVDTGMFEGLKQSAAKAFPEFESFLTTGLGGAMQGALAFISKGVEVAIATLENKAALARAKLQTKTQQLDFWSGFATRAIDQQTKEFTDNLNKEVEALEKQKEDLIRIEQEYQLKRKAMQDDEIEAIRKRIEAEYQLEAARLQQKYQDDLLRRDEETFSQTAEAQNKERLEEDHLLTLEDLRVRYNELTESEILALNDRMSAEDEAHKQGQVSKEETLANRLAEIEAQKEAKQKEADEAKKKIARDNARIQWVLGMNAFQIEKQANIAKAKVAGAMMVMQITAAAMSMLPWTLPLLGYIPAAISAAGMGIAAASQAQYPPPPAEAFAKGGIVTGGISGRDSVPAMLMPGELVAPAKNFDEVVNAVSSQREGSNGMNFNPVFNIYEQTNAQDLARETMTILYRETRNAQAAFL